MLAGQVPWSARAWHSLAVSAAVAALVVPAPAVHTASVHTGARGQPILRQVSYRGYSFEVPGSWPVIDLTRHPRDCVRFDRHAVYLGPPGRNEPSPPPLLAPTQPVFIPPPAPPAPPPP